MNWLSLLLIGFYAQLQILCAQSKVVNSQKIQEDGFLDDEPQGNPETIDVARLEALFVQLQNQVRFLNIFLS